MEALELFKGVDGAPSLCAHVAVPPAIVRAFICRFRTFPVVKT